MDTQSCTYGCMDYQGFIQRGRGAGIPPPPHPEILKLSMVIIVLSQILTTILSQIASEAI